MVRLVKGEKVVAGIATKKLASRGTGKTLRSEVGRLVAETSKGGKEARMDKCLEKGKNSLAGETRSKSTGARRVLPRRSTSEWDVKGKKKCFVEVRDVLKQEPMIFAEEEEGRGGEEENVLPVDRDIMPVVQAVADAALMHDVEEVAVLQMEIPNFQIDQATSLQEGHMEVDVERKPLNFLDSVKIVKLKIEQKKASLGRLKLQEEMKRANLQDLKAEHLEDRKMSSQLDKTGVELQKREDELQKRKAELEITFKAIEKERCEIVQRQQERDAKAAELEAEIEADERVKLVKEEELKEDEAEVEAALFLLQAA